VLAGEYKLVTHTAKMLTKVRAQAAILGGDLDSAMSSGLKTKLFFHPKIADRYAEVYLNIRATPSGNALEFHEKDPEYRHNVLLALTEPAPPNSGAGRE
jgi:hypothetical protein